MLSQRYAPILHAIKTIKKKRSVVEINRAFFLLGYPDSNQERQDQNLQCYHYTIPQTVDAIFELRVQR